MGRALVTGGTGFVGSNLVELLRRREWDVRCLARDPARAAAIEPLGVELAPGSLDDADSLRRAARGVDVVFHVAGRTTAFAAAEYERDNVVGTRNVVEAAAAQPSPPTVVMVSSLAAGGHGTAAKPRRESETEAPVSAYGRSKLAAERAGRELADQIPFSIVRPPMVFGPADHASMALYQSLKILPLHPIPGWRGFPMSLVYVTDLCEALVSVAERGERADHSTTGAGVYHVTTDRVTSYGELGRLAARAAGMPVVVVPTPRAVFWAAGAIGEMTGRARQRPTLINFDKVREAVGAGWVSSDEKIRQQLGYQPTGKLEDLFAATVAWYRERKWM